MIYSVGGDGSRRHLCRRELSPETRDWRNARSAQGSETRENRCRASLRECEVAVPHPAFGRCGGSIITSRSDT